MQNNAKCLSCGSPRSIVWATAKDVEYNTNTGDFNYRKCSGCQCLFIDPVPNDRLAQIYPSNYYSYEEDSAGLLQGVKNRLDKKFFSRILKKIQSDTITALDIGGGAGQQLDILKQSDSRIHSTQVVDLDPAAESAARAKGHDYFCGPIEEFSTTQKFDVIVMFNIIEHVIDPLAVLKKAAALLSGEGVLIIKTPNIDSLDAKLFRHRNWTGYHCPRHWVLFNAGNLSELCEKAGLHVNELNHTQGAPFWAGSLVHMFSSKTATREGRYSRIVDHPLYKLFAGLFAVFDLVRSPFSKPSQIFLTAQKSRSKVA